MSIRIGVDIDGVLADFNQSYVRRVITVTGKDKFPRPYGHFDIDVWDYPQKYGYTEAEVNDVWTSIKADGWFWQGLLAYPWTGDALKVLAEHVHLGHDVYFITARPGILAKHQTETWLRTQIRYVTHLSLPTTVLITPHKGLAARTLNLDVYIDDKTENCLDVAVTPTRTYMFTQPWNKNANLEKTGITRVSSIPEMLERL